MSLSAILFVNGAKLVFLIDLPRSIELAQCLDVKSTDLQQSQNRLLSCKPLEGPYASTEPKGVTKRQKLLSSVSAQEHTYHREIQHVVHNALYEIRSLYPGPWCLERYILEDQKQPNPAQDHHSRSGPTNPRLRPPVILSSHRNEFASMDLIQGCLVINTLGIDTQLKISGAVFRIPPKSSFLMSDINLASVSFTEYSRLFLNSTSSHPAGTFDVIIADPPWTNRSVRRSNTYSTSEGQQTDPFDSIQFLFRDHLSPGGVIAIWITNKESIKDTVLKSLEASSLRLVEEWIWVKITSSGEPVTDLEGLWRHPYELCLVFRHSDSLDSPFPQARRRVMAATPDLHSRKPNLKEMIQIAFPGFGATRVLEVFARSLTAGWWSWGNEVLKFASNEAWTTATEMD